MNGNDNDEQVQLELQLSLNEAIEESLKSHHNHLQLQEASSQQELAQSLQSLQQQQEETETSLAIALHESYSTRKKQKLNYEMNAYATDYTIDRSQGTKTGCWDCPACTLVNQPYTPQCHACHSNAPPHILTFAPIPALRYGLEIEILIPNGKTDGFTLLSIAQQLTSLGPEHVEFLGYSHTTSTSWKIVTDSSIEANNGIDRDLCFELVSPILQGDGPQGLGQLRNIMDNVRKIGIETNASCGFHVHVDAEQNGTSTIATLRPLKSISQCFVSVENAFDLLASNHAQTHRKTNQNTFCQSNRMAFRQLSNRQRWNQISSCTNKNQLVQMMNPHKDRYRKLNLTNIVKRNRPSTCEFRHHGGIIYLQEAEAWVRLILAFCHHAGTMYEKAETCCLLHERASVKEEVRALFDLVGCQGLEQVFTVDRQLFKEEGMRNEWSCKVCKRGFGNSRSLSQHCVAVGHTMH